MYMSLPIDHVTCLMLLVTDISYETHCKMLLNIDLSFLVINSQITLLYISKILIIYDNF